jgi:hypothetical protein
VERRGVNSSFKWFLPVFATRRGRGEGICALWCRYNTRASGKGLAQEIESFWALWNGIKPRRVPFGAPYSFLLQFTFTQIFRDALEQNSDLPVIEYEYMRLGLWMRSSFQMRSSPGFRASDCQSRNSPGFNHNILRRSNICGAAKWSSVHIKIYICATIIALGLIVVALLGTL